MVIWVKVVEKVKIFKKEKCGQQGVGQQTNSKPNLHN
jgi:hypothetical protein